MKRLTLNVQSVYLLCLIPAMLAIIVLLAWKTHYDLYRNIIRGFDKQLIAISTTTSAFLDGDEHNHILAKRKLQGLAFDPQTRVFYGVDNATGELVSVDPATGGGDTIAQTGLTAARDAAYDPETRVLYVVDGYADAARLVRIDPVRGEAMPLGTIGEACAGLAFDTVGRALYCSGKNLLHLDVHTGRGAAVGPIGFEAVSGLAFYPVTQVLYGVDAAQHVLLSIDVNSGAGSAIAPLNPQNHPSLPTKPPPYLLTLLKRISDGPIALKDQQIQHIEGVRPHLPVRGLAFGPDATTLFTSTSRLTALDPVTAVVRNHGFEGYWNELGRPYLDYIEPMRRIRQSQGMTYLYTFVPKENAPIGDFVYVLDVNTDVNHSFIGDEDQTPEADSEAIWERMKLGKTFVSDVHFWELWGLLKTGYAPILNRQGEVAAILGTDINVNVIERKTRLALLKTVLLGVAAMCLAGFAVYIMTRRLVEPIQRLQDAALNVAAGVYGLTVKPSGPYELQGLSSTFNAMSLELKRYFDEKVEANRDLQVRISRRELARTLSHEADVMRPVQLPVFCCRRLGSDDAQADVSGWVASESRLLMWFGIGARQELEAARRRREISLIAAPILERCEANWDRVAEHLKMLLTDAVAGFVYMDADHGSIRALTREPMPVVIMEASGIRQEMLTDERGVSLAVNQACVVGPATWIPVIQQGVERCMDHVLVAENIVANIEWAYVASERTGAVLDGPRSPAVVGVMSRAPWWRSRSAGDTMMNSE